MYIHTYVRTYLSILLFLRAFCTLPFFLGAFFFLLEIYTLGLCPGKGFSDIPTCWGNLTNRERFVKKSQGNGFAEEAGSGLGNPLQPAFSL